MPSRIAQGQQLYTWMNCGGCHSHGGGGMGPALMDDEWRYGGAMDEIAATIADGRPERHAGLARQAHRGADLAARRLRPHPVGPGAQGRGQRARRRAQQHAAAYSDQARAGPHERNRAQQ